MSTVSSRGPVSGQLHLRQRVLGARLWEASHRLWHHPEVGQIYPDLLFRAYCLARANCGVLEAAAARLENLVGKDPAAAGLLAFAHTFLREEAGHDEWVLEDLEALGVSRQEVLQRVPPPVIAAMMGAQWYWTTCHHPVSVLGYCFVVETSPAPPEAVEDLIRRTGLPRTAFRTFLRHAVIDIKHTADLEQMVDALPLNEDHLAMIGISMSHTLQCLAQSAEELVDLHEIRSRAHS